MHQLPLKNKNGSAVLIAMIAIALVSVVTYAGLQIGERLRSSSSQASSKYESVRIGGYISSLLSNPDICLGSASGAFSGIRVRGTHSINTAVGLAQDLELGTNLASLPTTPGHVHALKGGSTPTEFSVKVHKFYLVPTMSGQADVFLQVLRSSGQTLAPQKLGVLYYTTPGPLGVQPITACQIKMQTQQACLQMGCAWSGPPATPACVCNRPALDCTSLGPTAYVQGYTLVGGAVTPLCKYADYNCPAGQFLKGFDSSGALICTSVTSVGP